MKRLCEGSWLPAVEVAGSLYPHCSRCGREFGAQGRKAQRRLGRPWERIPRHFIDPSADDRAAA